MLLVGLVLAVAVATAGRALFPVSRVQIEVLGGVLRRGAEVQIETVSSAHGPVRLRLEAVQGGRTALLASGRVATRRWAFWDLRPLRHRMVVEVRAETLAPLAAGPVTLRATAIGPPAWLRQPAPTVQQLEVPCQP